MKRMTCAALAALAMGLAACGGSNDGSKAEAPAAPAATAAGAAAFEAQPNLSESVAALPRLVGEGAAIQAINADLDRLDAAARGESCGDGEGGFERSVTQPMTGPGYVSFMIAENYYCPGAAHPSFGQTALTYDLSTGRRVDWMASAPGMALSRGDVDASPEDMNITYQSEALGRWYAAKMMANPDKEWVDSCRPVFEDGGLEGTYFRVWADAENNGVAVSADLPHVALACAETAVMTADEMRQFGVPASLIDAIAAAHGAGNWAPKGEGAADAA